MGSQVESGCGEELAGEDSKVRRERVTASRPDEWALWESGFHSKSRRKASGRNQKYQDDEMQKACVYVCTCMCVCTCVHVYVCTCVCTFLCVLLEQDQL